MTGPHAAPRVAFVAAVPISLSAFMAPHVRAASESNAVTLVAGAPPDMAAFDQSVGFVRVDISRRIAPLADLRALVALWRLFRQRRFDAVVSITPKAGLLTMTAGRLARVPVRIHWLTGQVWATRRGAGRAVLKAVDKLMVRSATHLLADSVSQRDFLIAEGVVRPGAVTVLGDGSVCGVDGARFRADAARRADVRARLGIARDDVVALYLGRVSVEKGLLELAHAFRMAAAEVPSLRLLIVGPDEGGLRGRLDGALGEAAARVHFAGVTSEPEAYMSAADFFVLPSYREGFGSTIIEAASSGLPSIASRIYGLTDAVGEGTGVLVPVRDARALGTAMIELAQSPERRLDMGRRARERAAARFSQPILTGAFASFCAGAIAASRNGRPR